MPDHWVEPVILEENLNIPIGYNANLQDGVSTLRWVNRPNNTIMSVSYMFDKFMRLHNLQRNLNRTKHFQKCFGTHWQTTKSGGTGWMK